jgi:hypothetical protein
MGIEKVIYGELNGVVMVDTMLTRMGGSNGMYVYGLNSTSTSTLHQFTTPTSTTSGRLTAEIDLFSSLPTVISVSIFDGGTDDVSVTIVPQVITCGTISIRQKGRDRFMLRAAPGYACGDVLRRVEDNNVGGDALLYGIDITPLSSNLLTVSAHDFRFHHKVVCPKLEQGTTYDILLTLGALSNGATVAKVEKQSAAPPMTCDVRFSFPLLINMMYSM